MKIMTCPLNGPRNISEFVCFGPMHDAGEPDALTDVQWCRHLFFLDNRAGVIREWWRYTPSNTFFIAERNTVTDEIVATYFPDEAAGRETQV